MADPAQADNPILNDLGYSPKASASDDQQTANNPILNDISPGTDWSNSTQTAPVKDPGNTPITDEFGRIVSNVGRSTPGWLAQGLGRVADLPGQIWDMAYHPGDEPDSVSTAGETIARAGTKKAEQYIPALKPTNPGPIEDVIGAGIKAGPSAILAGPEEFGSSILPTMMSGAASETAAQSGAGPVGQFAAGLLPFAPSAAAAGIRGAVRGGEEGRQAMADSKAMADASGLPSTVGSTSGNPIAQGIEAASAKLPGGGPLREAKAINPNVESTVNDIIKQIHPNYDVSPPTPSEAGSEIKRGAKESIQRGKQEVDEAAKGMNEAVGGEDTPMSGKRTAEALQDITHQTGVPEIDQAVTGSKTKALAKTVEKVEKEPPVPTAYNIDEGVHSVKSANGETQAVEMAGGKLRVFRSETAPEAQGQGEATGRLETLAHAATSKGQPLVSDGTVSAGEAKVYDRLARRGWNVEKNPDVTTDPDGTVRSNSSVKPVYSVTAKTKGGEVFVHGTSPEAATQIEASGKFKPGDRNYDYSDFGQHSTYLSRADAWWQNPELAKNGRAIPYQGKVNARFSPDANVRKINTPEDLEKLAKDLDYKDWDSLYKDWSVDGLKDDAAGLKEDPNYKSPYDRSKSDAITQKAISKGIHGLDIGPQKGFGDMGYRAPASDQVVALDPSKLEVVPKASTSEKSFSGEWTYDPKTGKSEPVTSEKAGSASPGNTAELGEKTPYTFGGMRALRTKLRNQIDWNLNNKSPENAQLKRAYGAMSEDLNEFVASKGPDAQQKYEFFNSVAKQNGENQRALIKAVKESGGAGEVFTKAMRGSATDAENISRVMNAMDEDGRNTFRAVVLHRMGRAAGAQQAPFSADTFIRNWDKMSVEGKNALFGEGGSNQVRKSLDSLTDSLRNMQQAGALKSGLTSAVSQGVSHAAASPIGRTILGLAAIREAMPALHMAAEHPWATAATGAGVLTAAAINPVMSRVMTNPKVISWLATATKAPRGMIPVMLTQLHQMSAKDQDAKALDDLLGGKTGGANSTSQIPTTPQPGGTPADGTDFKNPGKTSTIHTPAGDIQGVDPATFGSRLINNPRVNPRALPPDLPHQASDDEPAT
jgi:hypothetical protein